MKAVRLAAAAQHLQAADEKMAGLVARCGAPRMRRERDAWRALSGSIIGQQLSVHAARAIRGRFAALGADGAYPQPAEVLLASDETLRTAGLSRNKILALRDLARFVDEGTLAPRRLARLDDEAIIQTLLPIRGVGRWTAEMFLIFSLGRPDVLAVDDRGLRNAVKRLYGLSERPNASVMTGIAAPWQPFRSAASWYLWRSLENEPPVTSESI